MTYKDFENKPLLGHTKLDYYECLAKIVLETIFPDKFTNLKIEDKPDLQNIENQIGIEVTRAVNKRQEENEKLYAKIRYGQIRDKEKAIKEINSSYETRSMVINGKEIKESNRYNDMFLLGLSGKDDFTGIVESFKIKLCKLNEGGYGEFLFNYLFIHSDILANKEMIDEAVAEMSELQKEYGKRFHQVYIYVPGEIYILDLISKTREIKEIKKYQYEWNIKAREMVIEYEINH